MSKAYDLMSAVGVIIARKVTELVEIIVEGGRITIVAQRTGKARLGRAMAFEQALHQCEGIYVRRIGFCLR